MKSWMHSCSFCGTPTGEFDYEQDVGEMCDECDEVYSLVDKSGWSSETKEGIKKLRDYFDARELSCSDVEWFILWHQVPTHSLHPVIRKLRSGEKTIVDILFEFSSLTYGDMVSIETEKYNHEGMFSYGTDELIAILEDESTVLIKNLNIVNIKILKMSQMDRMLAMIQEEHLNEKYEDEGKRNVG
ncbi:MAG: hypothetical protein ACTSPB_00115 [Candidatus Thorarchaeota archaeon]